MLVMILVIRLVPIRMLYLGGTLEVCKICTTTASVIRLVSIHMLCLVGVLIVKVCMVCMPFAWPLVPAVAVLRHPLSATPFLGEARSPP